MAGLTFDSAVARMLHQQLEQGIKEAGENLANGACIRTGAEASALAYSEYMGFVRGLRAAQSYLDEVEHKIQNG